MKPVGEIRPSQFMFTFGVGSTIDLPEFSVLVLGLDFWDKELCPIIKENRLLVALQRIVGQQLKELRLAPTRKDETANDKQGIPVAPFPRWMRCSLCGAIAPLEDGLFVKEELYHRPVRYVHSCCHKAKDQRKPPPAIPVRFLLACPDGHLTDVPWNDFVHDNKPCSDPHLYMNEFGITGDASDIYIKCSYCEKRKRLVDLVGQLRKKIFACNGLHPHLRQQKGDCDKPMHLMNLGASNLWFSQTLSVLAIPDTQSELINIIREHWDDLHDVREAEVIKYFSKPGRIPDLAKFVADDVLRAIEEENNGANMPETDIKIPEWQLFSGKTNIDPGPRLELVPVEAPKGYEKFFEKSMLAPRLTEVRAMYGFTRIDTQQELDLGIINEQKYAPLTRHAPTWLPAYESHGEGIFLRFREDKLQAWEKRPEVREWNDRFLQSHKNWRSSRGFKNYELEQGYPGLRFVLIHSFAHALMQQIVLDCGYGAASIRERIYCRSGEMPGGPMAGILLYTAAADSEGTLGGLVSLGKAATMGKYIQQALENAGVCASDPICAEHAPSDEGRGIHAAACHACLFSPETSCECGNRYLDRNVLVETFANRKGLAFF